MAGYRDADPEGLDWDSPRADAHGNSIRKEVGGMTEKPKYLSRFVTVGDCDKCGKPVNAEVRHYEWTGEDGKPMARHEECDERYTNPA